MCEIVIPEIHTFKKLESSQIICDDFISVPSMALILLVQVQSRVFTAKCSEPQVGISNGMDGGSGVAKFLSLRTETGYETKWRARLRNKSKPKR